MSSAKEAVHRASAGPTAEDLRRVEELEKEISELEAWLNANSEAWDWADQDQLKKEKEVELYALKFPAPVGPTQAQWEKIKKLEAKIARLERWNAEGGDVTSFDVANFQRAEDQLMALKARFPETFPGDTRPVESLGEVNTLADAWYGSGSIFSQFIDPIMAAHGCRPVTRKTEEKRDSWNKNSVSYHWAPNKRAFATDYRPSDKAAARALAEALGVAPSVNPGNRFFADGEITFGSRGYQARIYRVQIHWGKRTEPGCIHVGIKFMGRMMPAQYG